MKIRLFIFLLVLIGFESVAQTGHYYLSHYAPANDQIDYFGFDMVQGERGVIYFANRTGVMEFDGRNWNITPVPGAVYTVCISPENTLYLGGLNGFGRLGTDEDDLPGYQSLSDNFPEAKNIFSSLYANGNAYFLTSNALYKADSTNQVQKLTSQNNVFTALLAWGDGVYVSVAGGNIMRIEGSQLVESSLPFAQGEEILFTEKQRGEERYLMVAASGRLWIYDNNRVREIVLEDKSYLVKNVVVNATWVNENLIAYGTLLGGVLFSDTQLGETVEKVNFFTGLPDNEVVAIIADRSQGVWVAHEYGYTRIAPYLPFRTYNHYPGLEGNLLCTYTFNNQIYVGTSLGLYQLAQEDLYEEEVYYVTVQNGSAQEVNEVENASEERENSRRGLFGFLRRNNTTEEAPTPLAPRSSTQSTPSVTRQRRTRRVLTGQQFVYKSVEGVTGKVTQLTRMQGKLVAAGAGGVFEINGLQSSLISDSPVRNMFVSPTLNELLISTYGERVLSFKVENSKWASTNLLDTLRAHISYIFEDHLENIWLCSRIGAYKAETLDKQIVNLELIPFARPAIDETVGLSLGRQIYVATAGEFSIYDEIKNTFSPYDSLPGPRKYFASAGYLWFHNGREWQTVDDYVNRTLNLKWLGMFPDIRYLALAGNNNLWVITANNELYLFDPRNQETGGTRYPLFLREIRGRQSRLPVKQVVNVSEQESDITFEFIQPEFNNFQTVEYRYRVDGLQEEWSEWAPTNNIIHFPFVNPGNYHLNVESRTLLGDITQHTPINFNVLPPYWKEVWFYALEFIFFGSLVLLSLRLGAGNPKYRWISRLFSLLTVIMLIQLIQTAVESYISFQTSPVIDFFIQVSVAILVLPLEGRLRKFLTEASEGKYELKNLTRVKKA